MKNLLSPVDLKDIILIERNQYVMLDSDVAELYGVQTRVINQTMRNLQT